MKVNNQSFLVLSKVIISSVFCLFLIVSCKKDNIKNEKIAPDISKPYVDFIFPDTVIRNKKYHGKIIYKSLLDSITTKMGRGDTISRYVIYEYITSKELIENDSIILNSDKSGKGVALIKDTITVFNISFKEVGENYLCGIIKDQVIIENHDQVELSKIITNTYLATCSFIVVDE